MGVEELADGDVDEGLVEDHHLGVLVNVETLARLWDITRRLQELPVGKTDRDLYIIYYLISNYMYNYILYII